MKEPNHTGGTIEAAQPITAEQGSRLPLVRDYLRILQRRKWYIIGAVAIATAIAAVLTLLATPRYTATTQIEISREASKVVNVQSVEPESAADMEFYQTQYGLLASRSLAEGVMKKLNLANDSNFLELMGLDKVIEAKRLENDRAGREALVVKELLENVSVSPIRLSRLVNLSFVSPDPQESAKIANAWAAMFIESNIERRFDSSAYARKFLEDRLNELRQKLEDSERQAVTYASNESIINLPAAQGSTGDASRDRSLISDTLGELNTALAKATAERIAAEARLRQSGNGASSEALQNVAIGGMRERLAESEAEYARMLSEFSPQYPAAMALKARIDELRRSISSEEARVNGSFVNDYRDAQAKEQRLRAQVDGLKSTFNDQRRRSIQYNIFQREADTNRQLYEALLQRYKEIGVAAGVASNNISVVDAAVPPDKPSAPRPLLNLALALIAGLGIGVILAIVREQLDEALSDPSEVPQRFGLPLLGVIPATTADVDPVTEVRDPKTGMAEAYLSVENQLSFATDHGIPKVLTVTSTRPSEGKSTTAFALAYWLSRSGVRTLIVDGDMRSPSLHRILGVDNEAGLSNVLSGNLAIHAASRHSEFENLDYLSAGPQPPNAADLLRGTRLKQFFDGALEHYDHVIVDSPPVMGLADAPIIGNFADGTLFVIEAQGTKTRLALRAIERLRGSQAKLLGIVLSKFDARKAGAGYDYGYGYGYGARYGETAEN